jgi:hypothetical protein
LVPGSGVPKGIIERVPGGAVLSVNPQKNIPMKVSLFFPASDEGSGRPKGNGGTPAAIQAGNDLKAGIAAAADGPRFDQGLHYGDPHLRYPGNAVGIPLPDGGRVKMMLARRNDEGLKTFVANHITSMTDNPNFTTPVPSAVDLLDTYTSFETAFANWVQMRSACDDAALTLEATRADLVDAMNVRGAYVQTESNGNRQVIVSSGLEVRNTPTPVGQLSSPLNLRADLNGDAGVVRLKWRPTFGARGYLVECSPDVQPRAFSTLANTTKARAEKTLVPGETYVFRVAAFGGSTGQSNWSPEVIRGAA